MKTIRLAITAAVVTGVLAIAPAAHAGTINVNTQADEYGTNMGACALREAIEAANSNADFGGCTGAAAGPDTINLPAGTYTLTIPPAPDGNSTGDLDISSEITLDPTGKVTLDGGTIDRLFLVYATGNLTAADLTITRGKAMAGANGGGIRINGGGTVTLTGVTLTDNEAGSGGAIDSDGALTLRNVTISGNRAADSGGGVYTEPPTTLNNVTIANNTADNDADGTGNGGGIFADGAIDISNSIIGDNDDKSPGSAEKHKDCSGTLTSGGYNLIEDTTGCTIGGTTTGNITGKAPQLFALADNGGPTRTHALRKGSDAVDAGNPAAPGSSQTACETTDQRGTKRPQGPRCDIGAFEREGPSGAECLGKAITITGTSGPDVLTGTSKRDVIQALGGDDVVDALGGNDRVCAGSGNDRVLARSGGDQVTGGAGNDRAIGHGGDDLLRGQGGRDRLKGKGRNDTLRGGAKPDRLNGGAGTDTCRGGGGRDVIRRCEG